MVPHLYGITAEFSSQLLLELNLMIRSNCNTIAGSHKMTKIYLKIWYQPKIRAIPNLKERGLIQRRLTHIF